MLMAMSRAAGTPLPVTSLRAKVNRHASFEGCAWYV
jgi:hypothetical protein